MSEAQKVIKYVAIAFAIFLSVNIIGAIIGAIFLGLSVFGISLGIKDVAQNKNTTTINQEIATIQNVEEIENMRIEIGYSKLTIKSGAKLEIESINNNEIEAKTTGNTLTIKDSKIWNLWNEEVESEIIITLPENIEFEKVRIRAGSGEISISNLKTKNLDFDLGAGSVKVSNLVVENEATIDGGAGKVVIEESIINNLDLDVGVGEFQIQNSEILGNSNIDAGIGKLEVNLKGSIQDYAIKTERGLGSFTLQNKEVEDHLTYGEGENTIKIDAGVGKVEVNFINKESVA